MTSRLMARARAIFPDVLPGLVAIVALVLGFGMIALAIHAAYADVIAADAPPPELMTIRISPRAAHGLLRSLRSGAPMAGPEVDPLVATLAEALGVEGPPAPPAGYGEPAPIEPY